MILVRNELNHSPTDNQVNVKFFFIYICFSKFQQHAEFFLDRDLLSNYLDKAQSLTYHKKGLKHIPKVAGILGMARGSKSSNVASKI